MVFVCPHKATVLQFCFAYNVQRHEAMLLEVMSHGPRVQAHIIRIAHPATSGRTWMAQSPKKVGNTRLLIELYCMCQSVADPKQ